MKVLVFGATGGSGNAAVAALLAGGHTVTAFVRAPAAYVAPQGVRVVTGDVLDAASVDAAMPGHDAVVVALGISESALKVRLFGAKHTAGRVRSQGTGHVVAAMRRHGVKRLVVQSSYGVGDSRGRLPFAWKLVFAALLAPQIADTEVQEQVVRDSGLEWVLVQPVGLSDDGDARSFVSDTAQAKGMTVSRTAVGVVLAQAVAQAEVGRTLAVSR